jgi:hypothetical protein
MSIRNLLFLTATVTPPPGAYDLARANPSVRLEDYQEALRFYCGLLWRNVIDGLLMVENSNTDLTPLIAVAREYDVLDKCEFITFDGMSKGRPGSVTRFSGEINLIKYALEHAHVVRANPGAVVWKVTGRYVIQNLDRIVKAQPHRFDLYVNCRNYPARWVDFYVVGLNAPAFLRTLGADLEEYATSSHSGEYILRRKIDEGQFPGLQIVKRFNRVPRVLGVRGADGAKYHGFKLTIKYYVRVVMKVLAPWLWV